jgi:hypothetical protein
MHIPPSLPVWDDVMSLTRFLSPLPTDKKMHILLVNITGIYFVSYPRIGISSLILSRYPHTDGLQLLSGDR